MRHRLPFPLLLLFSDSCHLCIYVTLHVALHLLICLVTFKKMKGSSVEGKGFTESRKEELAKQRAADKRTVELNIDHRNTHFTDCMVINEMTRCEIC